MVKKMAVRNLMFSLYNDRSVIIIYLFIYLFTYLFLTKHDDNLTLD